jgi:hypothetical protein
MNGYVFVIAGVASMFHPEDFSPAIHVKTPYVCAMNVEPPGTTVEVENVNNGKTSHCIITGSGPGYGRVLDASPTVADELGYGDSIAPVRVYKVTKTTITECHRMVLPETCKSSPPATCVLDLPKPAIIECSEKF